MGTNYYYEREQCHSCGYCPEKVHIGKKSKGWRFLFRGYPDKEIYSYGDWIHLLSASYIKIVDEYGRDCPYQEFLGMVFPDFSEMSHFNVHNQVPMNPAEKKYSQESHCMHFRNDKYWKDDEGHDFSREEFC